MEHISQPTLLVNEVLCKKHISSMLEKAKRNDVIFRPHFKTHVSLEMGEWFRELGVNKITVSSLQMAAYFAQQNWDDITLAFPVNIREIQLINELAAKIKLNLVVENSEAIQFLNQHLLHSVSLFIKIDVGANRTGIAHDNVSKIKHLLQKINSSKYCAFEGVLAHAGQTYHAHGLREITSIHEQYSNHLIQLKQALLAETGECLISIGDTPTCSRMEDFTWADEIRPGNFIFYDVMQWTIGACKLDDIAVVMACPIVAKHEKRNEIIIHGGAVHFAKDSSFHPFLKKDIYGLVVELHENGWSHPEHNSYLAKLSQEHGTLKMSDELLKKHQIGDLIGVLPIHSCMTADCMRKYMSLNGKVIHRM